MDELLAAQLHLSLAPLHVRRVREHLRRQLDDVHARRGDVGSTVDVIVSATNTGGGTDANAVETATIAAAPARAFGRRWRLGRVVAARAEAAVAVAVAAVRAHPTWP